MKNEKGIQKITDINVKCAANMIDNGYSIILWYMSNSPEIQSHLN